MEQPQPPPRGELEFDLRPLNALVESSRKSHRRDLRLGVITLWIVGGSLVAAGATLWVRSGETDSSAVAIGLGAFLIGLSSVLVLARLVEATAVTAQTAERLKITSSMVEVEYVGTRRLAVDWTDPRFLTLIFDWAESRFRPFGEVRFILSIQTAGQPGRQPVLVQPLPDEAVVALIGFARRQGLTVTRDRFAIGGRVKYAIVEIQLRAGRPIDTSTSRWTLGPAKIRLKDSA